MHKKNRLAKQLCKVDGWLKNSKTDYLLDIKYDVATNVLVLSFSNQIAVGGRALRTALEGIVHQIRFPAMSAEEFARGPASEAILSAEVIF